jgi:hypothetical protein
MRRLIRFIVPVLVFGLGLIVGGSVSIKKRAAEFSAAVDRRVAEADRISHPPDAGAIKHFANDNDLITGIMTAIVEKDPLLRAYQLRALFGNLNSEQLGVVFKRAIQMDDRYQRINLLIPLLTRWAEIDPAAAKAAVQPYRDRMHAAWRLDWRSVEYSVINAWPRAMPEAALDEAVAEPGAWWARTISESALESLSAGDPKTRLAEIAKMPACKLRDTLSAAALQSLAEKDYAAAEAQLDLVTDPRKRTKLQAEILGKLALKDSTAAIDRMVDLAPNLASRLQGRELVNNVLRSAAKQNPEDALASIDRLPEELRKEAQGAALVGWAADQPIKALDWAVANNLDIKDVNASASFNEYGGGWNSLISTAFESDKEKTLAWLRSQPASNDRDSLLMDGIWQGSLEQRFAIYAELAPSARKRAVDSVINGSRGTDVSQMEAWVKGLPAGDERTAAVRSLTSLQIRNDPELASSLAENWPAGPERDAAFRGIAMNFSQTDPPRAFEFARNITDPDARSNALVNIAWSWQYRNAAATRAWVSSTPDLSADDKRVLLREFDER